MKTYLHFCLSLVFMFPGMEFKAQETSAGIVKYQRITHYDFATLFGINSNSNQDVQDWLASIPKEGAHAFALYFNENEALFEGQEPKEGVRDEKLQAALMKANYVRGPRSELKKVYYDLGKNKKTEEVEFMTRHFLVESDMENPGWKLGSERRKILDYICLGAILSEAKNNITAWFTPQIPLSLGPGKYFGLPGLILAIEINGETIFLATSVELNPPADGMISKPNKGTKVSRTKFNQIVAEKTEEYENEKKNTEKGGKKNAGIKK